MKIVRDTLFASLFVLLAAGCSTLRQDDPEKKVRAFLETFQQDLTKPDDVVLSAFHVKQSREAVLSVLDILRNKDPFIVCDAPMSNARIVFEQELVKVEVPATFRVKELKSDETASFMLVLWLTPTDNGFQITQLEGETFYQTFLKIKNSTQWEAEQKLAVQERLWIYENARKLEEMFDSVIWYTTYGQENYYYVVNGHWENYFLDYDSRDEKNTNVRMGLVNGNGESVIPVDYDLIGTIAFEENDLVEVIKEGKSGYFSIKWKQLVVEPRYDLIIPYGLDDVWAIVKQDTTIGWLDGKFQYQAGFPSQRVKRWFNDFEFLKRNIRLSATNTSFCEIPSPDHTGDGIIIPSSYLSKYGIFDEIEGGISTTRVPMNGWTEYKETRGSFFETVSRNISAVVTSIRERYLEGREEFYDSNTILFVNNQHDTLAISTLSGAEVTLHAIDSTLLEVRTPHDYWFGENEAADELNLYHHAYFDIAGAGDVIPMHSDRLFPQTQFVRLDSSYLTGEFIVYNSTLEKEEPTSFLSVNTITFMRDEILASYGYSFQDTEKTEHFQRIGNWYVPRYKNVEEFEENMTDIDKYNLAFLNKILTALPPRNPA